MNKFEKILLKDIAVSQTGPFGSQLHEADYVSVGTPIVTVEHLGEIGFNLQNLPLVSDKDKARLSKYRLKEGDIVFSRVGSIDRCTYVSKKEEGWLFSGRCLRVRFNEKADSRFVNFYFRQKYFKEMMLNISVGATMPSLNTTLMDNIPLFLPSKEAQQKIASVLSALDAKIELNNRINAELEQMAKTLYDYWFVQFDFPDENGKPYKSSDGKMIWNDELKREIPDGWEVKDLGIICDLYQPKTISEKEMISNGEHLVFGANGIVGRYDKFNHSESEIVVCCRGASCGNILRTIPKSWITGNAMVIHSKNEHICSEFIYQTLKWVNINKVITGSAQPQITRTNLSPLNILVPKVGLLKKFDSFSKPIIENQLLVFSENHQLSTLRDWLLPMLMNGQVSVKDQ